MNFYDYSISSTLVFCFSVLMCPGAVSGQESTKVFISVDLEGVGGVGSPLMTSSSGKDYGTARRYMTQEVNSVVAAIFERSPSADILVNDSHGDHQNILHGELDPRVSYIQGSIKPLGMFRDWTLHSMRPSSSDTMLRQVIQMASWLILVLAQSRAYG